MTPSKLLLNPIELREKWRKLPDYGCFWSSPDNKRGFQLTPTIEEGRVSVEMVIDREHSGFPGIAHGGVAYTILDGLMGWYIMSHYGRGGFTTRAETKYFAPLHVGKKYLFAVRLDPKSDPNNKKGLSLIGEVFNSDSKDRALLMIEADFFLPDRKTARKVLGIELGESGDELFPIE